MSARIMTRAALVAALALAACSAQQINTGEANANAAVASAQPTIAMACWLAKAADAGFQAYAASGKTDLAVIADEQKAMAGVNALCVAPPANVAQAVTGVLASYKAIVAETPPA
ncbi:MAG TPA: hypothetical protein VMU87_04485 [Stellaceae bacterium]|nr:hypothetical protein [Stellaceae bacterium]